MRCNEVISDHPLDSRIGPSWISLLVFFQQHHRFCSLIGILLFSSSCNNQENDQILEEYHFELEVSSDEIMAVATPFLMESRYAGMRHVDVLQPIPVYDCVVHLYSSNSHDDRNAETIRKSSSLITITHIHPSPCRSLWKWWIPWPPAITPFLSYQITNHIYNS